jgi:hypothetical protein
MNPLFQLPVSRKVNPFHEAGDIVNMEPVRKLLPRNIFRGLLLTLSLILALIQAFPTLAASKSGFLDTEELESLLRKAVIVADFYSDFVIRADAIGFRSSAGLVNGIVIEVDKPLSESKLILAARTVNAFFRKHGIVIYDILGVKARQGNGKIHIVPLSRN